MKGRLLTLAFVLIFLLLFTSFLVKLKSKRINIIFSAILVLNTIIMFFDSGNLCCTDVPLVKHLYISGTEITYQEVKLGVLANLHMLLLFAGSFYVLWLLLKHYWGGHHKKTRVVLLGFCCLIIAIINDIAVALGLFYSFYFLEYALTLLVICIAYLLTSLHFHSQNILLKAQEKLRLTQFAIDNDASSALWMDNKGKLIYVNAAACQSLGYSSEELLSMTLFDINPDYTSVDWGRKWEIIKAKRHMTNESIHKKKDGTIFPVEANANFIQFGGHEYVCAFARDITERKEKDSEVLRLAKVVNEAAESIVIAEPGGRIIYVNPAFEQMTGYTADEVLGKTTAIVKSGKHDRDFYNKLWNTIESGKIWRGRFTNRKKDGTLFEEDAVISSVRDNSGKIDNYIAVKRDVTLEVSLEAQLRHSQKMDALGRLAGGLAHDFTNMLVVIIGRAQIAKSKMDSAKDVQHDVDEIISAANRLSELTGQLLAFAHKAPISLRHMDLSKAVRGIEELLGRTLPENIALTIHTSKEALKVEMDPSLIEQVLVHLAINAENAMPNGGRLVIETDSIALSEVESNQILQESDDRKIQHGHFAVLTVSDTGIGISPDAISRIFDPFFTTQMGSKGSGLGLSTAYGIVRQHNGYTTVYSHPGHGSSFTVFIPLLEQHDIPDTKKNKHDESLTILITDDNPLPRGVLVRILHSLGHTVLEAGDGPQALDLARRHDGAIDLMIADCIMPDVRGDTLAKEVVNIYPDIKVIFSSGYPKTILEKLVGDPPVLRKPFTADAVARAIRKIMDV